MDPDDEMKLIRRDDDGTEIDREYWDRVNQEIIFSVFYFTLIILAFLLFCENMKNKFHIQGENVLNAAKMFEQNNQSEQNVRREPLRSRVQHFIFQTQRDIYCSDKLRSEMIKELEMFEM